MGEPALNPAVLEVLEELPDHYKCDNLLPSFSTVASSGCENVFVRLIDIKNSLYPNSNLQMQFSIHTTDQKLRDKFIPIKKWDFANIADYGAKFSAPGDRKITLNFALAKNSPVCTRELKKYFDPEMFIIKITPVNPTVNSATNNIESYFVNGSASEDTNGLITQLNDAGYEVLLSIGELEENQIGSNCGQFIRKLVKNGDIKKCHNFEK